MLKKMVFALAVLPGMIFGAELVKDGKPEAVIVLDENASKPAQFGALELQYHVQKMTGATLPIVTKAPADAKTKIYVGGTDASRKAGIKDFKPQEYAVRVKGNDIFLLGRDGVDKGKVDYRNSSTFPNFWEEIATTYAVYDFLEQLGVRWYLPTELGIAYEPTRNLGVKDTDIRRTPSLEMRDMFYLGIPASLCGDTVQTADRERLNGRDMMLWYLRRRHGGKRVIINHSMYTFYNRYWPAKKEWFAKGYGNDKPAQLCYTNPEVVAQVVQDARDYFDGKARADQVLSNVPADYKSDVFAVFPMDNRSYCKCPECSKFTPKKTMRGEGQFSNDFSSNYLFRFVNAVAKELKKTHPDKFIGAGAYAGFAYPPTDVKLEDNVVLMMCLHSRMVCSKDVVENDEKILAAWDKAYPKMKKYVWMYYCFPSMSATQQQTRYFPGFFAEHVGDYFKKYMDVNVTGMFWEPSYLPFGQHSVLFDQVEGYVNWKLAWDKSLDAKQLFDEFFTKYYGPAEKPMKEFYRLAESIYTNPANYPKGTRHQTDEIAWKYLGTDARMKKLGEFMAQAKKLAVSEPFKSRVELFDKGVWQYMLKGKKRAAELETLKSPSMQQCAVPCVENPVPGDPDRLDWNKAAQLNLYGGLRAEPMKRQLQAKVAHDGTWIYFQYLENKVDPASLTKNNIVWLNDEWESFFARQRGMPYKQVAVDPAGKVAGTNKDGTVTDSWDFPGKAKVSSGKDFWCVRIAVRMSDLVPGGIKPGETLYYNVIRSVKTQAAGCWIPTFAGYHAPDRFGELYLVPKR